jgi:predicted glycogen debranching enzyme
MLPNRVPEAGSEPEYNSVDASLWYVVMVHEFLEATASCARFASDRPTLLAAIQEILRGYTAGTRFAIHADTDGLLACGVPGVQLTWMDAKVGDQVVTPRIGKPVEVQALWLNALGLTARTQPEWQAPFEKGAASFEQRFWNEARGCLYDVVDADHQPGKMDDRLRPNQLFALGGLPLAFFPGAKTQRALQLVEDQLWTPLGLRSLAPGEKDYAPHYAGGPDQRDSSYHQGTVWPWLVGPFLEARVRLRGSTPEAKAEARALLEASQLTRPDLPGLLHVPEIADAEAPFTPRGCPFQAWSVGELLRLQLQVLRP